MVQFRAWLRRRLRLTSDEAAERLRKRVDKVWSVAPETKAELFGWYWMQHPMVRDRINLLISGDRYVDAYGRLQQFFQERETHLPLLVSISLGCGFGGLERDLTRRGMIADMDAYDLSDGAIREARRLAVKEGLQRVRYHVGDLNTQNLPPNHYDAVFAHSSVHHIEALENLFDVVHRTLKPGGVFHLNEFIGPNRFQWTDAQIRLINGYLATVPDRLMQMPDGRKPPVQRPAVEQMIAEDPTEAVRSAEIREVLAQHFDIVDERPYGGTLLHMGLGGIAQNFDMDRLEDREHLERFFELEDRSMAEGVIGSDFVALTAIRRSGNN